MAKLGEVAVCVAWLAALWLSTLGLAQDGKWDQIWELLAADPTGEHLAEVAQQAMFGFAELGPLLLQQLDPNRAVFYCPGPDCVGAILLVPARRLASYDQAGQLSRAYNQGRVVALLGVKGGLLIPGVDGFFLLVPRPSGTVALVQENGEDVGGLVAMHVWMFGVAPQPIPLPRPAESLLLPLRPQAYEVPKPAAEVGQAAEGELLIKIGQSLRGGIFSGVILFGSVAFMPP